MINMEFVLKMHRTVDDLIWTLEVNEDRLVHCTYLPPESVDFVKQLRQVIKKERPDYRSPYSDILSF